MKFIFNCLPILSSLFYTGAFGAQLDIQMLGVPKPLSETLQIRQEEVKNAVSAQYADFSYCFEKALIAKEQPSIQKIFFFFAVMKSGHIANSSFEKIAPSYEYAPDDQLEQCIANKLNKVVVTRGDRVGVYRLLTVFRKD